MSLSHMTDSCHVLVSRIPALVCSLQLYGTRLPLLVLYLPKDLLVFFFDLIYVVFVAAAVHFISEQTKFELIITFLSIIMSM